MKQNTKISIIVADDHVFFRDGLVAMLNKYERFFVLCEVDNGSELMERVKKMRPDLVITDITMPGMDGIEVTREIVRSGLNTRVIALSMHAEEPIIIRMLQAGAMGYLDKTISREELISAIESVVDHDRVYFPESTSLAMFRLMKKAEMMPFKKNNLIFSERELEVIRLVCEDYSSKEIASKLHLSHRTIESHRVNVMEKMNVKSVAGLVAYAYTNGLVKNL